MVIAGVLPSIAATLHVATPAAGQLVTVFSLAYAISAPLLGTLTSNWSRRTVLVTALAIFAAGNAITATATTFVGVLLSRIVAAAGAGLFTANASATAAVLAGSKSRGRAIALVMLGLTSSLILGAPLGTAISNLSDWRNTMWFVTALGILAGAVILQRLPVLREAGRSTFAERLLPLRNPAVLFDLLRTLIVFTGVFIPYTYISVVYASATTAHPQYLSVLLLVFGLAATVGNLVAGRLADHLGPAPVIVGASLALATVFLLTPLLNGTLAPACLSVALSGMFGFSLTTPQQHLLISRAPLGKVSMLLSLYQSVLYAGTSLSGILGAFAIELGAKNRLTVIAAVPLAAAAIMTLLHGRSRRAANPF
jgi:MFS transporter, DHA1 family, inner membrane transport protein